VFCFNIKKVKPAPACTKYVLVERALASFLSLIPFEQLVVDRGVYEVALALFSKQLLLRTDAIEMRAIYCVFDFKIYSAT